MDLDKLHDAALKRAATEASARVLEVLIELNLPELTVEFIPVERRGGTVRAPSSVHSSPADSAASNRLVAQARVELEHLLSEPPVWLGASGAFSAVISGAQLRKLSDRPWVKAIWPNRVHRICPTATGAVNS
jgi:hypothetical protein